MQGYIEFHFSDENEKILKYIGFVWDNSHKNCTFVSDNVDATFFEIVEFGYRGFVYIEFSKPNNGVILLMFETEENLMDNIKEKFKTKIRRYYRIININKLW